MSALLSRRAFSAGLALGVPAALLGKTAASQSILDPNGTGMDLESALLRVSPYDLRDLLVSTPLADGASPQRWENVSDSPYFTSVGGINVRQAGSDVAFGAYSIYLAAAGTRAGSYLGKRALENSTTDIMAREVAGYAAEVLVYAADTDRALVQVPIGNVMVLGYDINDKSMVTADVEQAVANAETLVAHLRSLFTVGR